MPYYIRRPTKGKPQASKRKRTKSTHTLIAKLDKVFSLFIRLRDSREFKYRAFRCISCGQVKPFEQADCGHFYSRRHMATRFDEENCHAECRACNRFSADHLIAYRENLIRKIGTQHYDLLTMRHAGMRKWSAFELERLIAYYTVLVEKMMKEK